MTIVGGPAAAVRRARAEDAEPCALIVAGLPDHFTPDVADRVRDAVVADDAWVVEVTSTVAGFLVVRRHPAGQGAEITWMAVRADRQRLGLGATLLHAVLVELRDRGIAAVLVTTLDRSAEYQPYLGTVRFWERHGFVQVGALDPVPGWEPGNPAALYVASLAVTAPPSEP